MLYDGGDSRSAYACDGSSSKICLCNLGADSRVYSGHDKKFGLCTYKLEDSLDKLVG